MIVGIPSSLPNNKIFAQITNDRDNDGLIDNEDPCPDSHRLFASCPAENSFSSSPAEDQFSIKECVISSGECTVNDILIEESGIIVCDPRQFDCTSYLTSSNSGNQDQSETQTQNTVKAPLTKPNTCNPKNSVCSSKDMLINDDGDVICNPTKTDCSRYSIQGGKSCNPELTVCTSKDILIDQQGLVLCNPSKENCSRFFKTEGDVMEMVETLSMCNPNEKNCAASDILIDDVGGLICHPIMNDCARYLSSSQEPLQKYKVLTRGNPNAKVLHATNPPLQYCNPRSENCTPDYKQIPGMEPWQCFVIITTDERICDNTPKPKPGTKPYSRPFIWIHYPIPDNDGLQAAVDAQYERDAIDGIACNWAEKTSEAVGAVYSCKKVAGEFKEALENPEKVVSKTEITFCGVGVAAQKEHKLSPGDPVGWLVGKEGKFVCKGTRGLVNWITGENNFVRKFMTQDYKRIQQDRALWCQKYGHEVSAVGNCWGLEIDYDNCHKAQQYWNKADPDNYGLGKMIKLRDGTLHKNDLGIFEYPCSFPPLPNPSALQDAVCSPEPNKCMPSNPDD